MGNRERGELVEPNQNNEVPCVTELRGPNKMRPVTVEELTTGFIVGVGCRRFAVSTKEELISKLVDYIKQPDETEKRYYDLGWL